MILLQATKGINLKLADEDEGKIFDQADAFIRAGGTVSLSEWLNLMPVEKAALVAAGNIIRTEQARDIARGFLNPEWLAKLEAELGDENAQPRLKLEDALNKAAEKRGLTK